MNKIYFILFVISSILTNAQNSREIIYGKITGDSIALSNVNIVNKTTNKGTVSNKNGIFKIRVKEKDILQFSNIQYETKKVIFYKKQLKNDILIISLNEKTNELQEVVIQNMAKKLGLPNAGKKPLKPTERKLNYIKKGGNITKIYAWISGDKKKLEILQKRLDDDRKVMNNKVDIQLIRNHFGDDFFINTIKIPRENIDGLIGYCIPKGIVFVFKKERYLEVVDLLIQNKTDFLNSLKNKILRNSIIEK